MLVGVELLVVQLQGDDALDSCDDLDNENRGSYLCISPAWRQL